MTAAPIAVRVADYSAGLLLAAAEAEVEAWAVRQHSGVREVKWLPHWRRHEVARDDWSYLRRCCGRPHPLRCFRLFRRQPAERVLAGGK